MTTLPSASHLHGGLDPGLPTRDVVVEHQDPVRSIPLGRTRPEDGHPVFLKVGENAEADRVAGSPGDVPQEVEPVEGPVDLPVELFQPSPEFLGLVGISLTVALKLRERLPDRVLLVMQFLNEHGLVDETFVDMFLVPPPEVERNTEGLGPNVDQEPVGRMPELLVKEEDENTQWQPHPQMGGKWKPIAPLVPERGKWKPIAPLVPEPGRDIGHESDQSDH